jgi:hypothetical protein
VQPRWVWPEPAGQHVLVSLQEERCSSAYTLSLARLPCWPLPAPPSGSLARRPPPSGITNHQQGTTSARSWASHKNVECARICCCLRSGAYGTPCRRSHCCRPPTCPPQSEACASARRRSPRECDVRARHMQLFIPRRDHAPREAAVPELVPDGHLHVVPPRRPRSCTTRRGPSRLPTRTSLCHRTGRQTHWSSTSRNSQKAPPHARVNLAILARSI